MNKDFKSIVILTGAGISAESGIKTFRDTGGLWENHSIEDVATYDGFKRNPKLVYDFYNARRRQLFKENIQPNAAHLSLARLEKEFPGDVFLVTQNIDPLHDWAGQKNLIHMHGELLKIRCEKTNQIFSSNDDVNLETKCMCCEREGNLRPHVVWFGEIPFKMDIIQDKLKECDLFLSVGTSSQVYPAAMFVNLAKDFNDAYTVELNLNDTDQSSVFHEKRTGKATLTVPLLVDELLS